MVHIRLLWLYAWALVRAVTNHRIARCITRGRLSLGVQRFEESNDCRRFSRTQVLAVCRHIAASLNDLADKLILRQPDRDTVQIRTSLSSCLTKRMTIAALLHLKHERALPFERCRAVEHTFRHRIRAPGVHVRAPRRELREMGKRSKRDGNQQHRENRNRSAPPAFLSFSGKEGKQEQSDNHQRWTDQKDRRFERRRQQ